MGFYSSPCLSACLPLCLSLSLCNSLSLLVFYPHSGLGCSVVKATTHSGSVCPFVCLPPFRRLSLLFPAVCAAAISMTDHTKAAAGKREDLEQRLHKQYLSFFSFII